jgi:hypothetical protein
MAGNVQQTVISRGSPSVALCPSYNANRLLYVAALGDVFKQYGLMHLQGILINAWSFLEEAPVWQFESNDGGWSDCEVDVQKALREAQSHGWQECIVRAANWCYSYNLHELQQVNLSTQRSRGIRCRDPFCSTVMMASHTKQSSGRKWQFQCGHGWADCDSSLQMLLEAARTREELTLTVPGPAGFILEVDLQQMTQTNTETGRIRHLRRSA